MNEVAMCKVDLKFVGGTVEYDGYEFSADFINDHLQEFFAACEGQLLPNEFEIMCDIHDFFEESVSLPVYNRFIEMLEDSFRKERVTEILNEGFCNYRFDEATEKLVDWLFGLAKDETDSNAD